MIVHDDARMAGSRSRIRRLIVRSMSWVRTQVVDFNKDKPIPQLVVVGETGATLARVKWRRAAVERAANEGARRDHPHRDRPRR